MRLTDKQFWEESYGTETIFVDFIDHPVSELINKYVGDGAGKTSLEIGSFPGSFLPTIGRKGYILNGVDFNDKNKRELPEWLVSLNFKVGEFKSCDFADYVKEGKKFDLVCSFGFIEHFVNFEELLHQHMELVNPGGQLVITAPNFRGWMQLLPHWMFDRANLGKHYLPSMNPGRWGNIVEERGFEIVYKGYFGGYSFWTDNRLEKNTAQYLFQRFCERSISQLKKLFRAFHIESSAFSAFCGIVVKKPL